VFIELRSEASKSDTCDLQVLQFFFFDQLELRHKIIEVLETGRQMSLCVKCFDFVLVLVVDVSVDAQLSTRE
jgi:hypothetical protein